MIGKTIGAAAAASLMMMSAAWASSDYPNLLERAEQEGNFKTFVAAVRAADLEGELKGTDNWTILMPTDEAFAQLPDGTVERLMKPENKGELVGLLKGHMVPGKVFASTWANEKIPVKTKAGHEQSIDGSGNPFKVNEASVIRLNVYATNGLIHVVDQVLTPSAS